MFFYAYVCIFIKVNKIKLKFMVVNFKFKYKVFLLVISFVFLEFTKKTQRPHTIIVYILHEISYERI